MKLFICWSGARSQRIAQAMHDWLPLVIPGLEPFLSSDMSKGSRWFEIVGRELNGSRAGLLCLTPENRESPWLHFEAGALLRESQATHIYTYLFEMKAIDLTGPLAAFQSTECSQADTRRLVQSIAENVGVPAEVNEVFSQRWPFLEQQLQAIGPRSVLELFPFLKQLFDRKTFKEPLLQCTDQRWVDRYSGARQTFKELLRHKQIVQEHARTSEADLYNALMGEVDGYAMDLRAHFLTERKFDFKQGQLDIPSDIAETCEKRRARVNKLVEAMLVPYGSPVLDQSRVFIRLNSFEEKKTTLIHPTERSIRQGKLKLSAHEIERCAASPWDFDRIVYYLHQEQWLPSDPGQLLDSVQQELEKLEAKKGEESLMPLHYSVRTLLKAVTQSCKPAPEPTRLLLQKIDDYICGHAGRDSGQQIRSNLAILLKQLAGS